MARVESVSAAAAPEPVPAPGTSPTAGRRRALRLLLVAVLLLALVGGGLWWRAANSGPPALTRAEFEQSLAAALKKAEQDRRNAPPDAAAAYRTILPSLVVITSEPAPSVTSPSATPSATASVAPDRDRELGAGTVVNADGQVLTALHVVDRGGPITVRFADGTVAQARVAQRQEAQDIAVLDVDRLPQVVVPAVLGGGVGVGDPVFPVGNPLGLTRSLSAGVVSALDRSVTVRGGRTLAGLIQFDAAVNPGSSGGPLLDRNGQVVGVVTALANPSDQPYFVGIGFAVPIASAAGGAGGPQK